MGTTPLILVNLALSLALVAALGSACATPFLLSREEPVRAGESADTLPPLPLDRIEQQVEEWRRQIERRAVWRLPRAASSAGSRVYHARKGAACQASRRTGSTSSSWAPRPAASRPCACSSRAGRPASRPPASGPPMRSTKERQGRR